MSMFGPRSCTSAHRAFSRAVLAFHSTTSSSCQELERTGLKVNIIKTAVNSRDEVHQKNRTVGGRFSRPLSSANNSGKPPSNYEKERVPPRCSSSRSKEVKADANELPKLIFRGHVNDDDETDELSSASFPGWSGEMGHRVAGGLSRGEETRFASVREAQRHREEYKQEVVERGFASAGVGDCRKQGGDHQSGRNREQPCRSSTEPIIRRPEQGGSSGISGSDRNCSGVSVGDNEYTTRRKKRETWDDKCPVKRIDGDLGINKRGNSKLPDEPHYGYCFRKDGPEIGEFRRLDSLSLSSGRTADLTEHERMRANQRDRDSLLPRTDREAPDLVRKWYDDPLTGELEGYKRPAGFPRRQEGEKKWQYAVRKKQQLAGWNRGKVNKSTETTTFLDDEELGNEPRGNEEEWRRKKLDWLCRELPRLKPRGVVTILNEQRSWIRGKDVQYIVEHLLKMNHLLRAHRVLKWEMQQPWYEYNFALNTEVANALGENNKLRRTRDLFDLMIRNQEVPELTTFVLLINCYMDEGTNEALQRALYLFNQMSQLGGHEPPASLRFKLSKALAQKNLTFLEEADEVFRGIKAAGLVASEDIYNQLVLLHGTSGNHERVDSLIEEMKELELKVGDDVYSAAIEACMKDGDVAKAEEAFSDLKKVWLKPIPSVYAALIKLYGKAGLPEKAYENFEELKLSGMSINLNVYQPIIEVIAAAGNRERAEQLVREARERNSPSMQGCYNALIRMYSEIGELEALERVFQEMPRQGSQHNTGTYNAVLEAYVKHGLMEKAEALYGGLKRETRLSPKTYELMIKAYGERGDSTKLNAVFKDMAEKKIDIPKGRAVEILRGAVGPKQIQALEKSKLKLHKDQREVLAGVLLGGARIESHDKNRTYEVHFELDVSNEARSILLQHLYSMFADWSVESHKEQLADDPEHSSRTKKVVAFHTVSHGSFRFFAHQYRPDGKPKIPRLVHRWLNPQTLAYWYMYGGHRCSETGGIILNASAYNSKELTLVVDALKAKTIDCEKKQAKEELCLLVTGKSASWLWKLMLPHIVPGAAVFLEPADRK